MKSIDQQAILEMLGMTKKEDFEDVKNPEAQYLEYHIDGEIYLLESTARNSIEDFLHFPVSMQKKMIAGIAAQVPEFGDSVLLQVDDDRGKKRRGGRLVRIRRDDGVIALLLTR